MKDLYLQCGFCRFLCYIFWTSSWNFLHDTLKKIVLESKIDCKKNWKNQMKTDREWVETIKFNIMFILLNFIVSTYSLSVFIWFFPFFCNPWPYPPKTRTHNHGYRYWWVQIGVALEYPRLPLPIPMYSNPYYLNLCLLWIDHKKHLLTNFITLINAYSKYLFRSAAFNFFFNLI